MCVRQDPRSIARERYGGKGKSPVYYIGDISEPLVHWSTASRSDSAWNAISDMLWIIALNFVVYRGLMGIWTIFCELPTKSAANKKDGSKIEGWLTEEGIGNDPNLLHINTWWSVSRQKARTAGMESHKHLADESLQCHSSYLPVHPLTKTVFKCIGIIRRKDVDSRHSNPSKIHADKHCLHPTKNNSAPVFLFAYITFTSATSATYWTVEMLNRKYMDL